LEFGDWADPAYCLVEHRAHADPHIGQTGNSKGERVVRIERARGAYLFKIAAREQFDRSDLFIPYIGQDGLKLLDRQLDPGEAYEVIATVVQAVWSSMKARRRR
jgi:hypothetical protein